MRVDDIAELTRDRPAGLTGSHPKGSKVIVRNISGVFSPIATVELTNGLQITVPVRDLRRTGGRGEASWERHRTWAKAKTLAATLMAAPIALTVGIYWLRGGDLSLLGVSVIEELAATLLAWIFGPYGLFVIAVLLFLVWRRRTV